VNRLALVVVLVAASVTAAPNAQACATAPPRGAEVAIAEEEALIVWDPATRTEQFIRRARFSSTANSFGFLVPTPTVPKLDEVPDHVFYRLADAIRPAIVTDTAGFDVQPISLLWAACLVGATKGDGAMVTTAPAVRVISVAHVAGFDATTLEADDATALAAWLAGHGFESTPALTQWLDRYVKDRWKLTAFVVASDEKEGTSFDLATRAVRMTFQTERPFYPYREPAAEPAPAPGGTDRTLRVFFVADQRYQAMVAQIPWHARVLHSAPIDADGELATAIGSHRMATVFVDDVSPRKGIDELYFYPSTSTVDVRQPPIVIHDPTRILIPVDLIVVLGLIGYAIMRRRRRRGVG
jgi:hypothetical protein